VHLIGTSLGGWIAAELAVRSAARLATLTLVGAVGITAAGEMIPDTFRMPVDENLRRFYADQVQNMTRAIAEYFPSGTKVTRPQGGQVLWVELPAQTDSLEVYHRAIQERIAIAPGLIFSPKQEFRNFIRLNCGNPWTEEIRKALKRLGQIIAAAGKGEAPCEASQDPGQNTTPGEIPPAA
jgi:DNA-binding transcriptional MocR family regulator